MKKLTTILALTGVMASIQCWALTVDVNRIDGYYTIPGGEFNITSVSPDPTFDSLIANYSSAALVGGGFETFCIQPYVELQPNPQNAVINFSGVASGTALLYSQFAKGTLSGYDYLDITPGGSGVSGRAQSALALQMAIWLEQGFTTTQVNDHFVNNVDSTTLANAWTLADAFVADAVGASGTYNVAALDLDYNGVPSQNMLVAIPDGGMTVSLLGLALCGLGLVSRKIRMS